MSRVARCTGKGRVSARPGWAGAIGNLACVGLLILVAVIPVGAEAPEDSDSGLTALFVRYYSAIQRGRWQEALGLMHERLKSATQVRTPDDLARRNERTQRELKDAFQKFDNLEVAKAEVDVTSIKAQVTGVGDGDVAGLVTYDLVVFPKSLGRSLMYRVVLEVGLSQGLIVRIMQQSITRIDPGAVRDVV